MMARPLPGDPAATPALARQHGLKPEEYERISALLGRDPTYTELGIFSALWNEHCAYKHSRPVLREFPTDGPQVLQGPGENAGVVRLGEGWAVAFKMESHNHPSAVEPYQGAATGVGGILRDVFTMGARPIAILDCLRFGPLEAGRQRYLMDGVVRGIGDYGNCVGVPTVGGDVGFDAAYSGNPVVNAMCVGLLREDALIRARAAGPDNPVIAIGSRTGRDGIHGASFASLELTADSQARRPQVQVGDPFAEKLLLEASLELISSGEILAIQDMGAAGLVSSSSEMAARGGVGVEIDVALVPVREPGMSPYEILLSESQERMLVVARRGREERVAEICAKWELGCAVVGRVTADGMYRVRRGESVVAELPVGRLVGDSPVYHPEARESAYVVEQRCRSTGEVTVPDDLGEVLERLLDLPGVGSKRWVYQQYDTSVQANTVLGPGGDAAVLRVPGTSLGVAVTAGCNAHYVWLDPREGGKAAVAEAARNIAVTGARPLAITDCLNFGSPEKPEVFHQFREACRGIAEACRALGTPVTGGNVSFYNESPGGALLPTPMVGMVGVLPDVARRVGTCFRRSGDVVIAVGACRGEIGGSQYLSVVAGEVFGLPPRVDLEAERRLADFLVQGAAGGLLASAHDVSEGGIAVSLVEAAICREEGPIGLEVDLTADAAGLAPHRALFGEDQARAVVSARPQDAPRVLALARRLGVPALAIGVVGAGEGPVRIAVGAATVVRASPDLHRIYESAIPRRMA